MTLIEICVHLITCPVLLEIFGKDQGNGSDTLQNIMNAIIYISTVERMLFIINYKHQ